MQSKKTSPPKTSSKNKAHKTKNAPVLPSAGYLSESWTDRNDALQILTKCAALIRGADVLSSDSRSGGAHIWAAHEAVKLINACELALKKEAFRSFERVEKQKAEVLQSIEALRPMSFDEGIQFLIKLADSRDDRLEKRLTALIRKDFEALPREARDFQEFRRIRIGESSTPPCQERFVKGEMAWYEKKGFTVDDLMRLRAHRKGGTH